VVGQSESDGEISRARPAAGAALIKRLGTLKREASRLRPPVSTFFGIWDIDAHLGNGTEAIVSGNNRIRFASVHQYPGYPGTGTVSRGNIFNFRNFESTSRQVSLAG
jgi:hypothetical protein